MIQRRHRALGVAAKKFGEQQGSVHIAYLRNNPAVLDAAIARVSREAVIRSQQGPIKQYTTEEIKAYESSKRRSEVLAAIERHRKEAR